jgi:uncharacterized protein YabN with tetrapyrrole methylase and pyrophosphatase domain
MSDVIKKIIKLENQAKEYGFYWPDSESVMKQINSEYEEVAELLFDNSATSSTEGLAEEIGDLLHAVLSLCIFLKFNPNEVLDKSVNKFKKRFDLTRKFALEDGHVDMHGKNMKVMMKYWDKAKKLIKEV